jgi:hypothetical protein
MIDPVATAILIGLGILVALCFLLAVAVILMDVQSKQENNKGE